MAALGPDGRCIAGLQHAILTLRIDGAPHPVAAIRNVVVSEDWRGRGLARDLFHHALAWCDARSRLALLYSETPPLYERFGFLPLAQHAVEDAAPVPVGSHTSVDVGRGDGLIQRLLACRDPVSDHVAMTRDGGLTEHSLRRGPWCLAYDPTLDALIVHEREGETLVLVDVIAPRMPSAARILGALGVRPRRLCALFPPDKLDWTGEPRPEDAGLMARGPIPAALRRPFVLPPTVEF